MGRRKRRNMRRKKDDDDIGLMDFDQPDVGNKFKVKLSKKMKRALSKREAQLGKKIFSNADTMDQDFDDIIYNKIGNDQSKVSKNLWKKIQKKNNKNSLSCSQDGQGFHMIVFFVKNKADIDRKFLLNSISNYVSSPIVPLGFFHSENSFTFYMEANQSIAESIKTLNKKLQSPSGELMGIKVSYVKDMDFILNCDQLELVKIAMAERYEAVNGILNLSSFYTSPLFAEHNTFAPLSNNQVFKQVCQIIKSNMPDIKAIDLSDNKLRDNSLKPLEILQDSCRSLSAINLEKNFILNFQQFRYFRNLPLKELKLFDCHISMAKLPVKYVRNVKKQLPFLKVLDGHEIANQSITALVNPSFETKNNEKLSSDSTTSYDQSVPQITPVLSSVSVNEEKVKTFLEQFYSLIDNPEGRYALIQAYTPTARIEIHSKNSSIPSGSFDGHSQISSFLSSWPATSHEHSSFDLQMLNLSDSEGVAQVQGFCYFQDLQIKIPFKRIMHIVPFNSGLCCCSDLLEIL